MAESSGLRGWACTSRHTLLWEEEGLVVQATAHSGVVEALPGPLLGVSQPQGSHGASAQRSLSLFSWPTLTG